MPEDFLDFETGLRDWVDTSMQVQKGIPCARCLGGLYGEIPKQPKPQKNNKNQRKIKKNKNKLRKQRAP